MNLITWIIFGALAGWVASKLARTSDQMGCLTNIALGIAGALIGGGLYNLLAEDDWDFAFSFSSFVVAVIGSLLFLGLVRIVRRA